MSSEGVGILEGNAMPAHIHLVLSIPANYRVRMLVSYIKGKLAIQIHREMLGVKKGITARSSVPRGYCLSTVGLDEKISS